MNRINPREMIPRLEMRKREAIVRLLGMSSGEFLFLIPVAIAEIEVGKTLEKAGAIITA